MPTGTRAAAARSSMVSSVSGAKAAAMISCSASRFVRRSELVVKRASRISSGRPRKVANASQKPGTTLT